VSLVWINCLELVKKTTTLYRCWRQNLLVPVAIIRISNGKATVISALLISIESSMVAIIAALDNKIHTQTFHFI